LKFKNEVIGKHYADFLVENEIVVEFKTVPYIKDSDKNQLLSYLKSMQKRLGLIVNFRSDKVGIKRIVLPDKYLLESD